MAKLTQLIANFETQLASTINVGGVSGFLKTPVKDDDGVTLPNGLYIMAFNLGESNEEHLSFTLDATTGAMTDIKSISRQGVESVGAKKQHRTGSKASITDFANLVYISNILKGLDTLDGNNPLKYDTDPVINDVKQLATKKYIDELVLAGAPDASNSTKGIVEMSTTSEIDSGASAGETSAPLAITPAGLAGSKYNKFKSTPGATNKILTENEIYTDGISANQPLSNASIKFGETDATGKNNKIYQSFIAGKDTIKSISIKKGNYPQIPINNADNLVYYGFNNVLTDSLGKSGTLTGAGSVSFVSDVYGNATSARRYGASGYGKDTGTLGTAITGAFTMQIRWTRKASGTASASASIVEVGEYNTNTGFGIWFNNTASTSDSVPAQGIYFRLNQNVKTSPNFRTTYVPPIDVPVEYKYVYNGATIKFYKREFKIDADWVELANFAWTTNPSSSTNLTFGCRQENTTEFAPDGILDYVAITNSAISNIMEGEKVDSDVVVKIYADNAGVPDTGTTLATITIPKATYNTIVEGGETEQLLSSVLNVTRLDTYWLEFSQATPSNTLYGTLAYQNTAQTGFELEKWNTTDGFISVTGALCFKISESYEDKLALFSDTILNYFGDGSDGDVTISTNTTLTRDMYYNNLTVNSGITLTTNNFKIFVKETLTNNGTIKGTLLNNGGARKQWNEGGVNVGGNGFFGGNGGTGGDGVAGGLGYIKSDDEAKDLIFFMNTKTVSNLSKTVPFIYASNVLGGGGGTSGNSNPGSSMYYGGKGGSGGGIVFICARNITGTGSFNVAGEIGENSGGGGAIGGGGGGGGCIIFFYKTTSNSFTYNLNGGNGGTPSGGNGRGGKVYQIKI